MPTIAQNRTYWTRAWTDQGDEWSVGWGGTPYLWHATILPRVLPFLPARHILEIAPGQGRCTQFLADQAKRLTIVDLVPECIEHCKTRFRKRRNIRYHVNDGKSLDMVRDGAVDFAFSWDSLVHVEGPAVQAYVSQLGAKLRLGGWAFLHHSNLGAHVDSEGELTVENPHWRAQSVSAEFVRGWAAEAGLACVVQELVPWGGVVLNDCLTLLHRPESSDAEPIEPRIVENHAFGVEVDGTRHVARLYQPGAGEQASRVAWTAGAFEETSR